MLPRNLKRMMFERTSGVEGNVTSFQVPAPPVLGARSLFPVAWPNRRASVQTFKLTGRKIKSDLVRRVRRVQSRNLEAGTHLVVTSRRISRVAPVRPPRNPIYF